MAQIQMGRSECKEGKRKKEKSHHIMCDTIIVVIYVSMGRDIYARTGLLQGSKEAIQQTNKTSIEIRV